MDRAVLSPNFFAAPDQAILTDSSEWLDLLYKWREILQIAVHAYQTPEFEIELYTAGVHPECWVWQHRQEFASQHLEPKDIIGLYTCLLRTLSDLNVALKSRGIQEFDVDSLSAIPEDLLPEAMALSGRNLASLPVLSKEGETMYIITDQRFCAALETTPNIHINAKLNLLSSEKANVLIEQKIDCDFLLVNHPSQIKSQLDPVAIWTESDNEPHRRFALDLYTNQRFQGKLAENTNSRERLQTWQFGGSFFDNFNVLEILSKPGEAERLLRSMAEVIVMENLAETHALRQDKGGDSPQRVRDSDGALAMRKVVAKGNKAYRLHYWERKIDGPEFADIVIEHDDCQISYK
ncbi:MAG: hypothetical protein WCJ37_03915 [Syntrophus sp. (in: bacteria)]